MTTMGIGDDDKGHDYEQQQQQPRQDARRHSMTTWISTHNIDGWVTVNPLKVSGVRWLHFEVFSAIQV